MDSGGRTRCPKRAAAPGARLVEEEAHEARHGLDLVSRLLDLFRLPGCPADQIAIETAHGRCESYFLMLLACDR